MVFFKSNDLDAPYPEDYCDDIAQVRSTFDLLNEIKEWNVAIICLKNFVQWKKEFILICLKINILLSIMFSLFSS